MKIASISAKIPSLKLTNEQLLDEIERHNRHLPRETVKRYQRELSYLLTKCGAKTRYVRDRHQGETALGLLKSAMNDALAESNLSRSDIDLLIYCGVGKGFLEPANAYFCAKTMGMNCQCFDVSDACMSWVRSLEIAYQYLRRGIYRNVIIVNAEFTVYEYGYPELLAIKSPHQLAHTFPAYTIGEGASATIVTGTDDEWRFDFDSSPDMADLCSIPLKGYEDFCDNDGHVGLNGVDNFVSFGGQLLDTAVKRMTDLVRWKVEHITEPDLWFPHAATFNPYSRIAQLLGIEPRKLYCDVFPAFGNLISASIPTAMHMAIAERKLMRGYKVVLCPASAGMSFAIVQFVF